jgi:hypothetical protein
VQCGHVVFISSVYRVLVISQPGFSDPLRRVAAGWID